MKKTTTIFWLVTAMAMLVVAAMPAKAAQAAGYTNAAFVRVSGATSIPIGAAEFCKAHRAECRPNEQVVDAVGLTQGLWDQLLQVNSHFNSTIVPVTDEQLYKVAEYWAYPTSGYGDCEDFVLAKRRALIEAGWPASTLLVAVVREMNGDGHAVLMVRTDRGDLVLDNQQGSILVWNETPYQYVKRQSQANPGKWVDIVDDRVLTVAAIR